MGRNYLIDVVRTFTRRRLGLKAGVRRRATAHYAVQSRDVAGGSWTNTLTLSKTETAAEKDSRDMYAAIRDERVKTQNVTITSKVFLFF